MAQTFFNIANTAKCETFNPTGTTFEVDAKITSLAASRKEQDRWTVTLFATTGDKTTNQTFEYSTGTGHRKTGLLGTQPLPFRATVYDWENSKPVHPDAKSVLICLGSDMQTGLDMPADDCAALDYIQDEFGYDGKPSEILTVVRALRQNYDKLRALLAPHGIALEAFAAWCAELDS